MRFKLFLSMILSVLLLTGCGYNQIQINDEQVNASWSEVLNQYKRRADLIPNLVQVVQGYAAHEKEVLTRVTEARANVAGMKVTPELVNDPDAMAKFQKAQGELSGALSRLLVVSENYPNLKADANFRDLQAQLEGTENRITVERGRFNERVQSYNTAIRRFPAVLIAGFFGHQVRPYFTATAGAETPPKVEFNFGQQPAPVAKP